MNSFKPTFLILSENSKFNIKLFCFITKPYLHTKPLFHKELYSKKELYFKTGPCFKKRPCFKK